MSTRNHLPRKRETKQNSPYIYAYQINDGQTMEISTHISHDHIILCLMGRNFFRTCFWHVTTTNKSYFSNHIYVHIFVFMSHICHNKYDDCFCTFVNCTQSSLHMHVCLYLIVDKPLVVWLFYDWRNLSYFILILVNILSIWTVFLVVQKFQAQVINNSFRTPPKVLLQTTLYLTSRTPHISYK